MENDALTLYCPNDQCQAPNPLSHKFCQRCSTALPKRYLWAVEEENVGLPGEILVERYFVIDKSILLDTKPGEILQTPEAETLQPIKPYLRLFPYRLHVPQVYGVVSLSAEGGNRKTLLLEKATLEVDSTNPTQVQLCSELVSAWRDATSIRQLNWLWQIANLWEPLKSEGVVSSLLDTRILRVEGSLVRLLQLRFEQENIITLSQLGDFWQSHLQLGIKPALAEFFSQICHLLTQGELQSAEQLIAILDKGLVELGRNQVLTVAITTKTDTGPSRQRNEDACYPPSGTLIKPSQKIPPKIPLVIVCDGIGGHEGGNVASNLAIETIGQQLKQLSTDIHENIDPQVLIEDLETAAAIANDKISERNDSEHRQGRQRMGTTLVMALTLAHEMYIAHVGDSRAYWITCQNCYQVTLDDDVASREVRLGYALYRDAVQQAASGSLVQALGMSPSISLHPTAQRFILDEDCVFLLCSDGLSDFDRVEQHWETEILPMITQGLDITVVAGRLMEIANTQNGHDNVTIALVSCKIKYSEPKTALKGTLADLSSIQSSQLISKATVTQNISNNAKTQVISEAAPTKRYTKIPLQLITSLVFVVAAGLLAFWVTQNMLFSDKFKLPILTKNPQTSSPTPTISSSPPSLYELNVGSVITTNKEIEIPAQENRSFPAKVRIPSGTLLKVTAQKKTPIDDAVLDMLVCQVANASPKSTNGTAPESAKSPSQSAANLVTLGQKISSKTSVLDKLGFTVSLVNSPSECGTKK